eukprot:scaffold1596_cov302-Pinguiococcus_pyrenoidosus.AAC.81
MAWHRPPRPWTGWSPEEAARPCPRRRPGPAHRLPSEPAAAAEPASSAADPTECSGRTDGTSLGCLLRRPVHTRRASGTWTGPGTLPAASAFSLASTSRSRSHFGSSAAPRRGKGPRPASIRTRSRPSPGRRTPAAAADHAPAGLSRRTDNLQIFLGETGIGHSCAKFWYTSYRSFCRRKAATCG